MNAPLFGALHDQFRVDPEPTGTARWSTARLDSVAGYRQLMDSLAGRSFDHGLYRLHGERSGPAAQTLAAEAFPAMAGRCEVFGFDWLGRQFAVDFDRVVAGAAQVLLLEPGTGQALEVPVDFVSFHTEELVEFGDAALARKGFTDWMKIHGVPIPFDQCVGYRVPLFLGGVDGPENMALTDIEVYWTLMGQVRAGTRDLPPGTRVDGVSGPQ